MDELSLADTQRSRLQGKQLGIRLAGSACADLEESAVVNATIEAFTGRAGARVVSRFTEMLLAPPDAPHWRPWQGARRNATFESSAELVLVTMADAWRRLVFARDREPYKALIRWFRNL